MGCWDEVNFKPYKRCHKLRVMANIPREMWTQVIYTIHRLRAWIIATVTRNKWGGRSAEIYLPLLSNSRETTDLVKSIFFFVFLAASFMLGKLIGKAEIVLKTECFQVRSGATGKCKQSHATSLLVQQLPGWQTGSNLVIACFYGQR